MLKSHMSKPTPKQTDMNIIDRVKNLIVTPAKEWDVIASETPDIGKILMGYVLPLAGAAALASFIGYAFVGTTYFGNRLVGLNWGLYHALSLLLSAFIGVFLSAAVIDALAPSFGSEKNFARSVQLTAHAYTPAWIGGLLLIFPPIGLIGSLFSIYSLYLLYVGLPKLKKTPADKHVSYYVISLLVMVVIYFVIFYILSRVLMPVMDLSYGTYRL